MRLHARIRRELAPAPVGFNAGGDLELTSIPAARALSAILVNNGLPHLGAGELLTAALIHRIQHRIIHVCRGGAILPLEPVSQKVGAEALERSLTTFCRDFPPETVFRGDVPPGDYLADADEPHRSRILEELWLLYLARINPALRRLQVLFPLEPDEAANLAPVAAALESTLRDSPGIPGKDVPSLPDALNAPLRSHPQSLTGQLAFLRREWAPWLTDLEGEITAALDLAAEEHPPPAAPQPPGARLWSRRPADNGDEAERFSLDSSWMADLVLLAKHAHVWLHQIADRRGIPVRTLAEIPDQELDDLAARGFTGIWLVGLWERSPASRRIKQLTGHPDALGSAYAVNRYHVAADLGGDDALDDLSRRALARGIRLGADMVPNHMGLDSHLIRERPELFIQRPDCPYPGYTFNGPELGEEGRCSIRIEDHYYDRSDAAVVFRYRRNNEPERYIYHGNDGTHIPWNDTAQLDFLQPDVRAAVLDQIRTVARRFPIIRFDAAMTLTRHHFRRLWYPPPGQGGAIPSRAESAMEQERFDRSMPEEFWRGVVDTAAREFPDTLLLAEAFWLMESYFVRRLGMHRVYNSAFMHMLRDEENAAFRRYMRTIWQENPQILCRFVNFLSNPDEEPAGRQFGRQDKYFGACMLMLILPGLPLFAHGQVEGLDEKYGMEFASPRSREVPDEALARHHEAFVFPLMRERHRFAAPHDLQMYALRTPGGMDENVLAFSRGRGRESLLAMVHNRSASTAGRLGQGELEPVRSLTEVLGVSTAFQGDLEFRDRVTGVTVRQPAADIRRRGLHFRFGPYSHHLLEYRGERPPAPAPEKRENQGLAISQTTGYSNHKTARGKGEKADGKTQGQARKKKKRHPHRR